MALTRRQFLTLMGGSTAGAVVFQACGIPPEELLVESPVEMPEDMVTGLDNWYATLCRQCPTSEGLVVRVMEGRAKKVEGNVDYPINNGKHSARCEAALQALYHPDRVSGPLVRIGERGAGQWEEISWTDALDRLIFQLKNLQDEGNQAAMCMVTEPIGSHLGMVVQSFVSKFGGQHIPLEPPERANLRAAAQGVFGREVLPDFDIENASYLLSFGADLLNTWVSPVRYARAYGEFRQGDRERGTLVHVDSRFSMTAANADEWVYVNPGYEGLLAMSMAQVIIAAGIGDSDAADALTGGGAVDLSPYEPARVADRVGVSAERIEEIAREFAGHRPALAIGGGSAGAHTNGLFNLSAIYSLNFLVGSVGQTGGVRLNPAVGLDGVPDAPVTASFGDWQRLVADMNEGQVKVLMVGGADPFYSLPSSTGFRDASFNVPFIFTFATHLDDTASMSDLVLPVHDSLEDWGTDIPDPGPGHRLVGFQQPVVRPFFESRGVHLGTRGFADVLLAAAQGLELDLGLEGDTFMEILQDGAKQIFDAGRGTVGTTRVSEISDFRTFWNTALRHGFWRDESATFDGEAPKPPRLPASAETPTYGGSEGSYPFALAPFASASLTDGRGAHLPWLQAMPDPITTATWATWIEINMRVADDMDIKEGDVLRVSSPEGSIKALAYPHPGAPTDVVSIPMGQGHVAGGRYSAGRGSNVLSILSPLKDSETGALAWAATRVRIEKTGSSSTLPRFENTAPDLAVDEDRLIIPLTSQGT